VEKECLGIKLVVEHSRLNRLKDKNSRLTRWSLALQPFSCDLQHRAGITNRNADTLSRIPTELLCCKRGKGKCKESSFFLKLFIITYVLLASQVLLNYITHVSIVVKLFRPITFIFSLTAPQHYKVTSFIGPEQFK